MDLTSLDPLQGLTGGGWMDPRTQGLLGLSTGLLQASAPSFKPTSIGETLSKGLLGGMQAYGQARQGQMQELQGALLVSKLKKDLEAQDLWKKMYAPEQPAQAAPAETPAGMSPSTSASVFGTPDYATPSTPAPVAAPARRGPSLDQIAMLGYSAPEQAKLALDIWKQQNPDVKWENGIPLNPKTGQPLTNAPILPQTNQQGFSTQTSWDPTTRQFNVGVTPGSLGAFTAQQDAQEGAKARRDIVTVQVNGRPVQMTREAAAGALSPQKPLPVNVPEADRAAYEAVASGAVRSATGNAVAPKVGGVGVGNTPAEEAFSKGSAENAVKYRASINERVSTGQDLMMRIGESERLLKDFQAGGGEGVRVQLAQAAQAVGATQGIVDGLARGDLGSAQAFQKIVVSQAMEALKQSMATTGGTGAGRITQAEFQIFQKANPNLELDPRALEKIYGFARKVHTRDFTEQQAFQKWVDDGQDPASFQASWAKQVNDQSKKESLKEITTSTGDKPLPGGVKVTRVK